MYLYSIIVIILLHNISDVNEKKTSQLNEQGYPEFPEFSCDYRGKYYKTGICPIRYGTFL